MSGVLEYAKVVTRHHVTPQPSSHACRKRERQHSLQVALGGRKLVWCSPVVVCAERAQTGRNLPVVVCQIVAVRREAVVVHAREWAQAARCAPIDTTQSAPPSSLDPSPQHGVQRCFSEVPACPWEFEPCDKDSAVWQAAARPS